MPLVSHNNPTIQDILDFQTKHHLTDAELGRAIMGGGFEDPGKIVRGWKSGGRPPSRTAMQSFTYLKALVRITDNTPLDGEENYAIAHNALPGQLK